MKALLIIVAILFCGCVDASRARTAANLTATPTVTPTPTKAGRRPKRIKPIETAGKCEPPKEEDQ